MNSTSTSWVRRPLEHGRRASRPSPGVVVIRRHAAAGLALGVAWGVAARIWMRLISTSPEFSWEGTLVIVVLAGLAGLCLGVVSGAGRAGRSRWWRLVALPALSLFTGPGMVFLPAVLLGGWSLAGRGPRWLRSLVAAVGLLGPAGLAYLLESTDPTVILPRTTQIVVGAGLLSLGLAVGSRGAFRRAGPAPATRPAAVVDSGRNGRQAVPRAAHQLSRARLVDRGS